MAQPKCSQELSMIWGSFFIFFNTVPVPTEVKRCQKNPSGLLQKKQLVNTPTGAMPDREIPVHWGFVLTLHLALFQTIWSFIIFFAVYFYQTTIINNMINIHPYQNSGLYTCIYIIICCIMATCYAHSQEVLATVNEAGEVDEWIPGC